MKFLFFVGLFSVVTVWADDVGRGGAAGAFLRMGLGARSLGMGGGSAALVDGANTAYFNPGGLSFIENRWVTGSLHAMPLNRRITYLGYAQPLNKGRRRGHLKGGFAVGWLSAGVSDIDGRDFSGVHTDMINTAEHAYYFSFAISPAERISIGFSAKLVNHRYPGISGPGTILSAIGFGFDAGIMVRPVKNLTLGLVLRDLRTAYTWDTQDFYELGTQQRDAFPKVFRAGFAWNLPFKKLLFIFDAEKVDGRPWRFLGGVEAGSFQGAFARAGFRYDNLTFGGGYRKVLGGFTLSLDYALLLDSTAPGVNHLFTWSMFF